MIADIARAVRRPELFEPSEAPFWDDPYIAGRLLEVHLDDRVDAASRPGPVIEETVAGFVARGLAGPGKRVLDLGCGPGLYAHLLAKAGCIVTGLDLSRGSIDHARSRAAAAGLVIDYRVEDFRTLDEPGQFDLVLQAYGELSTFADDVRDDLLRRIHAGLAPGGALVFDVSTPTAQPRTPGARTWDVADGGLWRPGPHLVLTEHIGYPDDVTCTQYAVADGRGVVVYRMWFHDYTPATLTPVLRRAGFTIADQWGSLTATPFRADSAWLAVVARPTPPPQRQ